jgi:hypothetical protein
MEQSKKELLERVLLLMKYDNKDTLSENISKVKVLTEQPNPNKVPKNQSDKDAITNCKMQPRNYTWSGFAPKNKESVDKFCNSLQLNYPSFYSKTQITNNPNPQTTPKPQVLTKEPLRKYSIEQLIKLYESNTGKGEARVSVGTNKDNIITVFAEKVAQLSLDELRDLINKNPKVFKSSLSFKGNSISAKNFDQIEVANFKYNVDKYGPLILLVDYEVWEKQIKQYNKNPGSFNNQPPIQPNWKDLIDKFKLSSLIQYQYSPTQFVIKQNQDQRGIKGYTQKGYASYGSDLIDIQFALVDLGLMKEGDVVKQISFGKNYKYLDVLKKYMESGDYDFGNEMFGTRPEQKSFDNVICYLKTKMPCEGFKGETSVSNAPFEMMKANVLSWLRANAYPQIEPDPIMSGAPSNKEQQEKFKQSVKDAKLLKISIYDVDGKIIPVYSRGDDPDLPTYGISYGDNYVRMGEDDDFGFKPQIINLGPIFSILDDEQVKTLVYWLVEWCTEPFELDGYKGRKIVTEGGSGLNLSDDLISSFPDFMQEMAKNESLYPNCIVDFANKETNGDIGKWMIKFLKLPEEQIELLLQFYPEDYRLIQTYLPGKPGSTDFYLSSPLVKNAVRKDISVNPTRSLAFMDVATTIGIVAISDDGGGFYPIEKITDYQVEKTIKRMLKDCPNVNQEFKAIAGGQKKHKGYIVGQYYSSLPTGFIDYTIPCKDYEWDEDGWKIVMGGVLLASLIFPPLFLAVGWELELAILARMTVDVGLNVYSAHRNRLAGNEEAAKIDMACAMLSFIVDTPGFEKKFLKGFGDWAEASVWNKLKAANPNTGAKMRNFVTSLSKTERRHLYDIINTPRFFRKIQIYGKDILNKWLKQQFGSQFKNIAVKIFREIGVKLPVLFSPIMLNMGYKMFLYSNQISQNIFKVPLDETQWKAFEWELKNRGIDTPEEADALYETLKNDPKKSKEFVTAVGKKIFGEQFEKIKNQISVEKVNEEIKKTDDLIRRLEEASKNEAIKAEE